MSFLKTRNISCARGRARALIAGFSRLATVPLTRSHALCNDNLFPLRRLNLSPAEKYQLKFFFF